MPTTGEPHGADKRGRQRQAAETRAQQQQARAALARRRRVRRGLLSATAAVVLVALVGFGLQRASRGDEGARASYDASSQVLDFALPQFDSGTVTSADLRGKPAVINFYASWCTVCDAEMPDFQAVSEQAGDKVAFVGVNPQSNDSDARQAEMVKRTGVRYDTVRDRNDDLLRLFNTTGGLPTTLFVDADGKVVRVHNGGLNQDSLKAAIAQYLSVSV